MSINKREVQRLLDKHGCTLIRVGTKHDVYARPTGTTFVLSRHPGDNLPAIERIIRNGRPALTTVS